MRLTIDEFLIENSQKKKFEFIHNDMWNFKSKDLPECINLSTREEMLWGFAYGVHIHGIKPFIYSVSFFNIGRFEQFRKFFLLDPNANFMIFNAGHVGYDNLPEAHRFTDFNEEDVLMERRNVQIMDSSNFKSKEEFKALMEKYLMEGGRYYIKLGEDHLWEN